jgi:hypothetical protein
MKSIAAIAAVILTSCAGNALAMPTAEADAYHLVNYVARDLAERDLYLADASEFEKRDLYLADASELAKRDLYLMAPQKRDLEAIELAKRYLYNPASRYMIQERDLDNENDAYLALARRDPNWWDSYVKEISNWANPFTKRDLEDDEELDHLAKRSDLMKAFSSLFLFI